MKLRTRAAVCALLTLLAAGCGGETSHSGTAASPEASAAPAVSSSQEEKKPLEGHLTVKTYWDEAMPAYIRDFTALHPGVTIDLIARGEEGVLSFDDYHTQTAVELMSGSAADLVEVDGFAVYKYAKSGVFRDLYPLMDADPEFDREDYYTNVLRGKEFRGALYSMPCGFLYHMVYASRPLLEEAKLSLPETLDYEEMLALQKKVAASTAAAPKLLPGLNFSTFFWQEYPGYFDTATRTARFTSLEFLRYLRLTKENIPASGENDMTRIAGDDSFLRRDYLFCLYDVSAGGDLTNFLLDHRNIAGPVPLVSTTGKWYFRSMREYAIPAASPNQQLAWEFLKFYIGEKEVPQEPDSSEGDRYYKEYNAFVPINKANFYNSFRFAIHREMPYYDRDPALRWREGDREALIEEALDRIHGWNQQVETEQAEGEIYGLLCEDLDSYYLYDLLTAEETASRMQSRMTIFLQG